MLFRRLVLCAVGLLVCSRAVRGDEASAVATLKAKGINKTGSLALAADTELSKKLREEFKLKKLLQQATQAFELAHQAVVQNDQLMNQLNEQLVLANRSRDVASNNAIVGELRLCETQRKQLTETEQETRGKANKAREDYLSYVIETRRLADKIQLQYKLLAADKEVVAAVEELNKATGKTFALVESKSFLASMKALKKIEDTVLSDEIALRRSGNTLYVSTMINNRYSKEMIVDSGASLILLPIKVANDMGVNVPSDAETIKLVLADGNVIEGKKIDLPVVRVGRFEVEHVECAVLSDKFPGAEPLLGMSFLGKFNFKIDPDAGKLTMTRVEGTGEGAPAGKKGPPKKAVSSKK